MHHGYRWRPSAWHAAGRRHWRPHYRWRNFRRSLPSHKPAVRALDANPGPVFLGDLFITSNNTPLFSRPMAGAQILARLPKRTLVTNMGRFGVTNRAGRVVAYYYKVEAPNGAVGFVSPRAVSTNAPVW
jgi:hypothetical protein